VDVLTREQRSRCMSAIKNRDTRPEMIVRRLVHGMGYRFRLHVSSLPGKPDLVLPRLKKVIFVNGCFWHMHRCRYGRVSPASNAIFWRTKREQNVERDRRNSARLRKAGWRVLVVWECGTRDPSALSARLRAFLER
jgi:DNA mismatch endonuclease (patch repair protein)